MRICLVLILAATLFTPTVLAAQGSAAPNKLRLDQTSFARLQKLIGSQDSVRARGRFGELMIRRPTLTMDSLLATPDGPAGSGPRVALGDVTGLQVRGGASGTGALVGAGVGLGAGLAAGLGLASSLCSDALGCSNETGGVAIITLASTLVGTLIGALLGAPVQRWHTIYRAP